MPSWRLMLLARQNYILVGKKETHFALHRNRQTLKKIGCVPILSITSSPVNPHYIFDHTSKL